MTDKPRYQVTYEYIPWVDGYHYVLTSPEQQDGETIVRGTE